MSQMQQPPQQSGQQFGGQVQSQQGSQMIGGQVQQTAPVGHLFPTRNYLPEETRKTSIATLNQTLADLTVVQSQLKAAHWNVKGPGFYQLHELFGDVAEMIEGYIDDVAERVTALGGEAFGTVRIAAQNSNIPQWPADVHDQEIVLQYVADHLAELDTTLYDGVTTAMQQNDLDTADLLNEVSRQVSKSLWFVEAHIQGGQPIGRQAGQSIGVQGQQSIGSQVGQSIGGQQSFGVQGEQPFGATGEEVQYQM